MVSVRGHTLMTSWMNVVLCAVFLSLAAGISINENFIANITAALLLCLLLLSFATNQFAIQKEDLLWSFAGFFVYVVASSFWALNSEASTLRMIKLCLLLLPAVLLLANYKKAKLLKHWQHWFLWPYVLAIIFFNIQCGFEWRPFDASFELVKYNSMAVAGAVLFWPAIAVLLNIFTKPTVHRFSLLLSIFILVAVSQYITMSDAGVVSLLFGLVGFVLFKKHATWLIRLFIIISVLFIIFVPPYLYKTLPIENYQINSQSIIVQKVFEPSHLHRLEIWDRCYQLVLEKPYFGWGLTGSYHLPSTDQPSVVIEELKRSDFLYPHNLFLQLLIDFGAIGLIAFLWFLHKLVNWIDKKPNVIRSYAGAAFCSILIVYYFGFPLWRSWWIVLIACIALVFRLLDKQNSIQSN